MSRWVLVAALVLFSFPANAASLDPNLKWKTAETEHFVVYWYEGEELAAKRVLEICEPVFEKVTASVDWKPKGKTHLVLTDVTDTANGFAITVPFNTIRLFITAPQEGSSLDNYDDWLMMLLTHEMTHVAHIDKIGGVPWLMRGLFGSIIDPNQIEPRWIVEGYATFQETELSSAGRGRSTFADMLLRAAILEGNFPEISQAGGETQEWPSGYIPYIFGVEFLQWLKDRHGAEAVEKFTEYTAKEPFPFFPFYPRLNRNAKKAFGKSFYSLWREWRIDLQQKYGDQKAQVESFGMTPVERLTKHGSITQAPRLSPDGKKIVYSMSNGKGPASVRVMDADGKNDKVILGKYTADGFGWTPDSKTVAFGAEKLWRDYYVWSDVYTFTLDDERLNRVTRGARARTPDFKPDGSTLLFVTNDVSNNDLAFSKIDQTLTWITNNKDWTQYSTPRWRPDGELVAVSAWLEGGYREILLLGGDGRLYQRITADRFLDRDPTWTADGKYLLFSSDRTGIANIYAWEQATASFFQVTNVLHGAFQPSTDGKWIVFQGYGADGYDVYRTTYDPTKWKEVGWTFDPEVYDATCKPPKDWNPEAAIREKTSDVFSRRMALHDEKTSDVFSRHVAVDDEKTSDVFSRGFGGGAMNAQEPQPDPKEAAETAVRSGGRPKNRPDKNAGVDLSAYKVKERYNPFRTMAPRFWLPAQVWFTESGATFGAFTGGADPLFRHSWTAWANYNTKAAFVGGGGRYFYDRWKPTFYGGADVYVLDYGQSVYEYPDFFEPGSHLFNIHSTGEHYFERHISAQVGAYYLWRSKWFLSFRYLFDNRTAWTDLGSLTYDPFLPVRGNFAGPSVAITLDRTEMYRWSISPQKGWRATVTLEAQEPVFAGQLGDPEPGQTPAFRKEIATADFRAYTKVPLIPFSVLGVRVVGGFAQGDAIRPSTFRLGGALGESVFSITTPNYYSLRGYPFFAFGGERLLLASAEYRFPIWRVNRGIGTGPFFLRQIHGGLFADTGNAWEETEDFSLEAFHTGVGGEVRLDTIWYYYFPLTIRLGYGFALNDDPAGYAPGDPYGLILTLGTSF